MIKEEKKKEQETKKRRGRKTKRRRKNLRKESRRNLTGKRRSDVKIVSTKIKNGKGITNEFMKTAIAESMGMIETAVVTMTTGHEDTGTAQKEVEATHLANIDINAAKTLNTEHSRAFGAISALKINVVNIYCPNKLCHCKIFFQNLHEFFSNGLSYNRWGLQLHRQWP